MARSLRRAAERIAGRVGAVGYARLTMQCSRSVAALAVLAGSAIAVSVAGAAAAPTPVGPGDTIAIAGTEEVCVIPVSGQRAIVCELSSKSKPLAKSYATATTDTGALIFAATGKPVVVATRRGAKVSGPLQSAPRHKPEHITLSGPARVLVVGSDIQCDVAGIASGHPSLDCGLYTATGRSHWVPGTYATTISNTGVAILLAGKNGASSIATSERQP